MKVYRGYNNEVGPISYAHWIYVTPDIEQAKWYATKNGEVEDGDIIEYDLDVEHLRFLSLSKLNSYAQDENEIYEEEDLLWYQEGLGESLYKYVAGIVFKDPYSKKDHTIYIVFSQDHLKNGRVLSKEEFEKIELKEDDYSKWVDEPEFPPEIGSEKTYYRGIHKFVIEHILDDEDMGGEEYFHIYNYEKSEEDSDWYEIDDTAKYSWKDCLYYMNDFGTPGTPVPEIPPSDGSEFLDESARGKESFWKWFSGSKVVDKDGKPLVVYHGTNADEFNEFKLERENDGFYFTADKEYAKSEGKNVIEVYLNIKNPRRITYSEETETIEEMKKEGYDGIFITDMGYYVAFYPNQIKSIKNGGRWDGSSNNIYETVRQVNRELADTLMVTSAYELNEIIKNNKERRILYDKKNKWFLVGDPETSIHINLLSDALQDGYYQPFEWNGEMIDGSNENDGGVLYDLHPNDFVLFRTSSDSLNGEDYYYDRYQYCYIYKDYCVFDRKADFEETPLYKFLGEPIDIENNGNVLEDEGINESIVYGEMKDDEMMVILHNPTRKELKENGLDDECRIVKDGNDGYYFASSNYTHEQVENKLKLNNLPYIETIGEFYYYQDNLFATRDDWNTKEEYEEYKRSWYNSLKSMPYIVKNFGNFRAEVFGGEYLTESVIKRDDGEVGGYYTQSTNEMIHIINNKYPENDVRVLYDIDRNLYIFADTYSACHFNLILYMILFTNVYDNIPEIKDNKYENDEVLQDIIKSKLYLASFKIFRNYTNDSDEEFIRFLTNIPENATDGYSYGYACKINDKLWAICRDDEIGEAKQVPLLQNKTWVNLEDNTQINESVNLKKLNRLAGFYHYNSGNWEMLPRTEKHLDSVDDYEEYCKYCHDYTVEDLFEEDMIRFHIEDIDNFVSCAIESPYQHWIKPFIRKLYTKFPEEMAMVKKFEIEYYKEDGTRVYKTLDA